MGPCLELHLLGHLLAVLVPQMLEGGVGFQVSLVGLHGLSELGRSQGATAFVVFLKEIKEPELCCGPNVCFETLAKKLAVDFNSCEEYAAADVLQQVVNDARVAELADALDSGSSP